MRTNHLIFLILVQFIIPCHAIGHQSPITASPSPATTSKLSTADQYSQEPYVFELVERNIRFEADGKGQHDLTLRVRIQSESAVHEFGLLVYPYASSFETLDVLYVRVRRPDGTVIETPPTDIQELDTAVSREAPMYTDQREKHIAVKSLSIGDILEAQLRWTVHDPIAPGHFWFDHWYFTSGICLKETLRLDVPADVPIKLRNSEPQPSVQIEGGRRVYTFNASSLKKHEASKIPEWEKNYHGAPLPDLEVSSFPSWADVGAWYGSLQQSKIVVTPEIRAKAEELTKGKTSDDEKLHAIYDFVSTRFRYIGVDLGVGRYSPHAASDVLINRYGDCKDKHTLFTALLQAAGITAYPVLISSKYRVDPSFPTASIFDHVITAIPRGDSFLFLDTTPEVAPYALLVDSIRDRQALVIPSTSPARLVTTPADPPFPAYEHARIEASIDTNGTLDAKIRIEDRGDGELLLRSAYRATPQNRWQELTQNIVSNMGFGGTVSDVSVDQPEDTSQPFWMSFSYHRTDYPDWKDHRVTFLTPPVFLRTLNEEEKLSKDPLPLGALQEVTYDSTMKFPENFAPLLPEKVEENTDFAEYSAKYDVDKNTLHGTLHFKTLLREVPGAERARFSSLSTTIDETSRRYIFVGGDFSAANGLGPNLLGLLPGKVEDAIPVLEKSLADNPGREPTLVALGRAYCSVGRPKDAVAILEKALAKNPDHSLEVHLVLADAYLAVPDSEKALLEYKKGLGADPAPSQLNSVAYSLADANIGLSDALVFSTRAVSTVASESMDISPDNAKPYDFALMAQLAANWDTLGWIKFRTGDYNTAEKYLQASWQLDQTAATGEHLVEVYEKQGKTQKAASICNMAKAIVNNSSGSQDSKLRDRLAEAMKRLQPHLNPAPQTGASSAGYHSTDGQVALVDLRSLDVHLSTKLRAEASHADFVISITNGPKVDNVVFLRGSDELRDASAAITATKFPMSFPDVSPTRILRKASLSCSIYAKQCLLLLSTVEEASPPAPNIVSSLAFAPGNAFIQPAVSPAKPLYEAGQRAGTNRDYVTGAQLYEQAVAKDPKYMDAWNALGWTYNNLKRYDKAEAALRKALEIVPTARYAHNNLGQALEGQKKYNESIPEFEKEIELNPKDPWAHENLGRVYVLLGQFDKAVPVLEAAATAAPENPAVQFNLGRAYAKTGQPDKAAEALSRSVELEPTPARWNGVAYEMALDKIELGQAQKYAESAISLTVEHLKEISLESLSNEDAQLPATLAAYWDTLGWIHFRQEQITDAEKYVNSAWQLRSIGEIGDHLAQIYEKENRKQDAIQMYAMALASPGPMPETKSRLVSLLGSETSLPRVTEGALEKLTQSHTIKLKNSHDADGIAEFWVLLTPGQKVADVKFISGDESLRPFASDLQAAPFANFFPDATEVKLPRRGKLTCSRSTAQCSFLLMSSETVRSAN
jgi:tetratricopeptide (TPR) repeat protein/transglutaminase-like putative cysteine protease